MKNTVIQRKKYLKQSEHKTFGRQVLNTCMGLNLKFLDGNLFAQLFIDCATWTVWRVHISGY